MEKKTILLVEDESLIAMMEKRKLENYGYRVQAVLSGEKAIEIFQSDNAIDLILMDIDLGIGMDGTVTAEKILSTIDIPIVFFSNHTEPEIVRKTEKITSYGYVVKDSGITVLDASIKMAFKLFDAKLKEREKEVALRENETRFRELFENLKSGVAIYRAVDEGRDFIFRDFNRAGEKIEKKKREEILGRPVSEVFPGVTEFGLFDVFQKVWRTGEPQYHPVSFYKDNRLSGWRENYVYKLPFGEIVAIYEDKTEQKQAEEALRIEKKFTDTALDALLDTFFLFEPATGRAIRWNRSFRDTSGYTDKEISRMPAPASYYSQEDLERTKEFMEKVLNKERGIIELELICKDGHRIPTEYMVSVIKNEKGEPKFFISIGRDITRRRQVEKELRRRLVEKEIILKEAHHRIKNNMTSIENLLAMQSEMIANPDAISALQEAVSRVFSMRVLYEKMLLSGNYLDISVRRYLEDLLASIIGLFSDNKKITYEKHFDDFLLTSKVLFPIGIIVNELITNILKHAFVDKESGHIQIEFIKKGKRSRLVIQDNGRGLPDGFEFNAQEGFGFMLVNMLAQQIGGEFNIENRNGTRCTLEFDV